MSAPYWTGDSVTLYLGDCREIAEWLSADVLVTDPPYGRGWGQHGAWHRGRANPGIAGDRTSVSRGDALRMWGERPAIVFGDLMLPVPDQTKQVLVHAKGSDSGIFGAVGGFRRDAEAIYLIGRWSQPPVSRSGVLRTGARSQVGAITCRYGHPHAKPVDVMETLIAACPLGVIADPFCGSGSTLVAARNQGRSAIGVEIYEPYCELAARRLSQGDLFAGEASLAYIAIPVSVLSDRRMGWEHECG